MALAKRLITVCLSLLLVLLQVSPGYAQTAPDIQAPIIEFEAIAEAVAGDAQVFTAQVADDRNLKDVTLYYRRAGQSPFTPIPMTIIGDSTYYSATVRTQANDLRAFEYYIQARDESGNRTVEGYAFDPYRREIVTFEPRVIEPVVVSKQTVNTEPTQSAASIKWWHIALGVVALGALASAGGGGDSGDSGSRPTVPLTINIAQPGS